jgi:HlyD family secretion protein
MADKSPFHSLNRHALFGVGALLGFTVLLGGWAGATQIAGAIIAPGMVVTEEGTKAVQHPEGGVVSEIGVRDGDTVNAGDVLVRLDSTTVAANLAVVVGQLSEAFALEARLNAESARSDQILLPPSLDDWPDRANLERLVAAQQQLRVSRNLGQQSLLAQLDEQVAQLGEQIEGLEAERKAVEAQLSIIAAEADNAASLLKQNLTQVSRVNDLERQKANLQGQDGSLLAQMASARTQIAERKALKAQNSASFDADVLEQLRTVGAQIAQLMQQKIAAEDRLAKLEIRAPQGGIVHESVVRTVGGVITPGEVLMRIIPQESPFAIEARVSPTDVDKLSVGQPVAIRLMGFDIRTVPELAGSIETVSPDLVRDTQTGVGFYTIKVALPPAELAKLPSGQKLVPGMPAEAFVHTADRTVLAYLIAPFAEQLSRAMRED